MLWVRLHSKPNGLKCVVPKTRFAHKTFDALGLFLDLTSAPCDSHSPHSAASLCTPPCEFVSVGRLNRNPRHETSEDAILPCEYRVIRSLAIRLVVPQAIARPAAFGTPVAETNCGIVIGIVPAQRRVRCEKQR
jgi:hypothetical protein